MRVLLLGATIAGLAVRSVAFPTSDWSTSEWLSVPEFGGNSVWTGPCGVDGF